MKAEIKAKMISKSMDRVFHVAPYFMFHSDARIEFQVPFLYDGIMTTAEQPAFKIDKGHFAYKLEHTNDEEEKIKLAPLDGMHRIFAIAEIMIGDDKAWLENVETHLTYYLPNNGGTNITPAQGPDYETCLKALSSKISDENMLSLNTTLIDACQKITEIDVNIHLEDFYLQDNKANGKQNWNSLQRDYRTEARGDTRLWNHLQITYKTLTKSDEFLDVFRRKWKGWKTEDYAFSFWSSNTKENFLENEKLKYYYVTEVAMTPDEMWNKLNDSSYQHRVEKNQSFKIDYTAFCVAQSLEPAFFNSGTQEKMKVYLRRLNGSNLICCERLMYISTLAFTTAKRIVKGFLTYDDFSNGKFELQQLAQDSSDYFENFYDDNKKMEIKANFSLSVTESLSGGNGSIGPREKPIRCFLFNYIASAIFGLYAEFDKIRALNEQDIVDLTSRLCDLKHSGLSKTQIKDDKLCLSLELARLVYEKSSASRINEDQRPFLECMDLLALRYVDYLRIIFLRNGSFKPITQHFIAGLLHGKNLAHAKIDPFISIYNLDGKNLLMNKVYDKFSKISLEDMNIEDSVISNIPKGKKKGAYNVKRKKLILGFLTERVGSLVTDDFVKTAAERNMKDSSFIKLTKKDKDIDNLCIEGEEFIRQVLSNGNSWFWNPLDVYSFLTVKPTNDRPLFSSIQSVSDNFKKEINELYMTDINPEWAKFIQTFNESLLGHENEVVNDGEEIDDEGQDKETSNPSHETSDIKDNWDHWHNKVFKEILEKQGQEKHLLMSNVINLAISSFVKTTQRPKLQIKKGKNEWTDGDFSSKDLKFSDKKLDEIEVFLKEYSNRDFFRSQNLAELIKDCTETSPPVEPMTAETQAAMAQTIESLQSQMNEIQRNNSLQNSPNHPIVIAQRHTRNYEKEKKKRKRKKRRGKRKAYKRRRKYESTDSESDYESSDSDNESSDSEDEKKNKKKRSKKNRSDSKSSDSDSENSDSEDEKKNKKKRSKKKRSDSSESSDKEIDN